MALYVDVRVNDRVVARAAVQNVRGEDVCDYEGRANSEAFGSRPELAHLLAVSEHDRRESVWLLVAKMALEIAAKEGSEEAYKMLVANA